MKYKASAHVLSYDGKPIPGEDKKPATFARLVQLVLIVSKPHDKAADKLRVHEILKRTHDTADTIELTAEDVTLIKKAAEAQPDALYGALHDFLENPETTLKAVEP